MGQYIRAEMITLFSRAFPLTKIIFLWNFCNSELFWYHKIKEENLKKEVILGKFGETFSPQDTELTYRVEIEVYGLVKNKDAELFEAEFEKKESRLRETIRKKIRNSDLEELSKNNLGLLERRILTEFNHQLSDHLLTAVGFISYQLIEQ